MHWARDDGDGDIEEDKSEHDGQPEQEWDDPVLVMTMYHDTGDPPAVRVSVKIRTRQAHGSRCAYPVKSIAMKMCTTGLNFL